MSGGGFFSFDDDLPVPKDDDASAEQQEAPPKDGDPANEDHAAANPARPPSPPSRPSARIKITDDPYAQFAMTGLITDDPSKVPHFLEEGSRDGPTWARLAGTDSHGWPDGGNPLWLYNSVTNIYVQTSSQGMYRAVEGASVGVTPIEPDVSRLTGTCQKWNPEKGFGFIHLDSQQDTDSDIFVHHKQISVDSTTSTKQKFRRLFVGQKVSFTLGEGANGKICAQDVKIIDEEGPENDPNELSSEVSGDSPRQGPAGGPAGGGTLKSPGRSTPKPGVAGDEEADVSSDEEELNVFRSLVTSHHSSQGALKEENQDRIAEKTKLSYFGTATEGDFIQVGLFDGHNGSGCAEYASHHLHTNVAASLNNLSRAELKRKDVVKALKSA